MKRKIPRANVWKIRLVGLVGLVCLLWAAGGLLGAWQRPAPAAATAVVTAAPDSAVAAATYYPLEVGRFWVYQQLDPGGGSSRVERRIAQHQRREGRDLYFYGDGALVFERQGRFFEMGPGGGVNVIPVDREAALGAYVYRSEGLHIEKSLGAVDTTVVIEGKRYSGCIEVVTHYRPAAGGPAATYLSYYARGIGLVGRRPGSGEGTFSLALREYGVEKL